MESFVSALAIDKFKKILAKAIDIKLSFENNFMNISPLNLLIYHQYSFMNCKKLIMNFKKS